MKAMLRILTVLALIVGPVVTCAAGGGGPVEAKSVAPAATSTQAAAGTNDVVLQQLLAEVKALRTEQALQLNAMHNTLQYMLMEQMNARQSKTPTSLRRAVEPASPVTAKAH